VSTIVLIALGCIAFVTGVMLVLFPNVVQRLSTSVSKTLFNVDKLIFKARHGIGVSLMLIGAGFWFFAFYFCVMKILTCF